MNVMTYVMTHLNCPLLYTLVVHVIKIEHLTEQYSTEPLGIMCTAENAHGESTVNFGSIPVSNCGGEVSDVRLSPFGPRIDLTVGDIETINCTASNAEPDSRVALYHNGTRVLDNTLHSYDPVACIRQISLLLNGTIDSDAGDYTCVYNQGNILRTSSVSVTVMPVPKDEPRGQQSIIMPVLAAGGSTVVLIITLAIFLMMYLASNSIKYYLKWRLREPEYVYLIKGVEKKYVFDVFLSFADEDKEATERLIKEPLETRGYEICWHHDDFMPGKNISENIDDNIRDSRKVLFVLSEDFFKSLHCVRELDTSIRKLKKTKTRCVVPILLRDCERLLPTDIKDLTYLDARSINEEKLITTTCVILGKPLRDIGFSSTIFSSDPEI